MTVCYIIAVCIVPHLRRFLRFILAGKTIIYRFNISTNKKLKQIVKINQTYFITLNVKCVVANRLFKLLNFLHYNANIPHLHSVCFIRLDLKFKTFYVVEHLYNYMYGASKSTFSFYIKVKPKFDKPLKRHFNY